MISEKTRAASNEIPPTRHGSAILFLSLTVGLSLLFWRTQMEGFSTNSIILYSYGNRQVVMLLSYTEHAYTRRKKRKHKLFHDPVSSTVHVGHFVSFGTEVLRRF